MDLRAIDLADDDALAAAMTHRDTPDTTWIVPAVAPGDQGSGVGTALVGAAEQAAPAFVPVESEVIVQRTRT